MSDLFADIPDLEERRRALDPQSSFIVQAPAGSGKTELLIQRTLVLLATVNRPEEVIAMTFTRKAAAEMQKRLWDTLIAARTSTRPEAPHKAVTWDLARAVVERDASLGWNLAENASRLRIQTIDSLCAFLTGHMPVTARFGAKPEPIEDEALRQQLYIEAARNTLALLDTSPVDKGGPSEREGGISPADDVARLLGHLDNNLGTAEGLIAAMLRKRDHWLRQHGCAADRDALQAVLQELRLEAVGRAASLLIDGIEAPDDEDVAGWRALVESLVTKAGGWRKKHSLYNALEGNDALLTALVTVRSLPPPAYSEKQWEALGAIARLLLLAVAQLKLVFASRGQADFVEIAQGALAALGSEGEPTDLALALDYRIRHVLIDEFQDTSFTQYELLEKLTAGWEKSDGRTLFVVGDPMQSIYRFREAQVGLFLRARREGIGSVALEPLTLSANFRSQADIVDWVNRSFAQVMPAVEDIGAGAVTYSDSVAVHPAEDEAVKVHALFNDDGEGEADEVVTLVRLAQFADPDGTIAILVRGRRHLEAIVPKLKEAGLAFRAIEIEPLGHRQVVQDLLALTRALSHLADRIAWLATLRAPWCGLTLADLHSLAGIDTPSPRPRGEGWGEGQSPEEFYPEPISSQLTLWELMHDEVRLALLTPDGRARLERTRSVLSSCLSHRFRSSLRDQVESAWLALGGPACVVDDTDLEDADIYLDHLEASEVAGGLSDLSAFEQSVSSLYARPDLASTDQLQIMTIHKAKGLEFDTVILPGLGSGTRPDEPELFVWMERTRAAGSPGELLIAPIKPSGSDKDPIYETIRRLDKEKAGHESGRVLYVAATRAKKHLHLLGNVKLSGHDGVEVKPPSRGSLLEKLWPAVEAEFEKEAQMSPTADSGGSSGPRVVEIDQSLRRLPSDWTMPAAPAAVAWTPPADTARVGDQIEFSWVGETARHVGSVVHRWLQRIAEDEMKSWDRARVEAVRHAFRDELTSRGVEEIEIPAASERVVKALMNSLEDERGRWLLGLQNDARNEYRITAVVDGERRNMVIDRTFVDADGKRWIVDYKTSSHEGADIEAFLDREQERYRGQLEAYAKWLTGGEKGLGLYFPLLNVWRSWRVAN